MPRKLIATKEYIEKVRLYASGKNFTSIHRNFPEISESLLYVILRENDIEYDKGLHIGDSRRTLQRRGDWVPGKHSAKARIEEYNNRKPGMFRHEDYRGIF